MRRVVQRGPGGLILGAALAVIAPPLHGLMLAPASAEASLRLPSTAPAGAPVEGRPSVPSGLRLSTGGDDRGKDAANARHLIVEVRGLPRTTAPRGILVGPDGFRRVVSARRTRIRSPRAGRYTLRLQVVHVKRSQPQIKAGARVVPARKAWSVRVGVNRTVTLTGRYGSIINLNVRTPSEPVVAVRGAPDNPSAVIFRGRPRLERGTTVSLPPDARLPRGLLARVSAVSLRGAQTEARVRSVSPFDVAPVLEFAVPLQQESPARMAQSVTVGASCGTVSALVPLSRISNVRFTGGWNVLQAAKAGAKLGVEFDAELGAKLATASALRCSLSLAVNFNGLAGPVPVTASFGGDVKVSVGGSGDLDARGSVHVVAGVATVGTPPFVTWVPQLTFTKPAFTVASTLTPTGVLGFGLGIRAGIGNSFAGSLTVKFGASADLTFRPGSCRWIGNFGQFSLEAKVANWTAATPATPPLFSTPLSPELCGAVPPVPSDRPSTPGTSPSSPSGYSTVTALAPNAGPGGYEFPITGPDCIARQDESAHVWVEPNGRFLGTSVSALRGWETTVYAKDPPGKYQAQVRCFGRTESGVIRDIWIEPIEYEVLSPRPSVELASAPSKAEGTVTFVSGASLGQSACPTVPGLPPASSVFVWINSPIYGFVGGSSFALPTTTAILSIPFPNKLEAGDTASAVAECTYPIGAGTPSPRVNFRSTDFVVGP